MKMILICVVIAAISYLLGSLNFGIIISKIIQNDDSKGDLRSWKKEWRHRLRT